MMVKNIVLCLAVVAISGCADSQPKDTLSVKEAIRDIHILDGKEVAVSGWLGRCDIQSCPLYPSLKDAYFVEKGSPKVEGWLEAADRSLSIGRSDSFDREAAGMQFDQVIIRGKIRAFCRADIEESMPSDAISKQEFCFDRVDEIQPVSVERVYYRV